MSDSKFDFTGTRDPQVTETQKYTNILSENIYEFMTNAFYGTGGYRYGQYLIPHTREMFYFQRRQLSYYKNFMKPITRAMIDPCFSEKITRIVTAANTETELADTLLHDFLDDCDNQGTNLQKFMEQALYKARLHGVVFVVMDNFSAEEMPPSLSEARQSRIYPYIYMRTADSVVQYELDKWGCLVSIMFKERPESVVMKGDKVTTEDRYRRWTREDVTVLKRTKNNTYEELKKYVHGLGQVPVLPVYSVSRSDFTTILVDPPLFDIARLNHAIYNIDSEIRSLERNQGFSLLYVPSDNPGDLTISDSTVLHVPMNSPFPPAYIAPDAAVLTSLTTDMKDMVDQLYKLAEQNGVVGVKEAKSGVAKQWDFFALEGVLKKTTSIAVEAEIQITKLFNLYTNNNFELTSEYPWDFGPVSVGDEIDTYDKIIKSAKSQLFRSEIEKKQAKLMLNDLPREKLQAILDDIETVYAEQPDNPIQDAKDQAAQAPGAADSEGGQMAQADNNPQNPEAKELDTTVEDIIKKL